MIYKNKKSRSAIPGYTLIPEDDHYKVRRIGNTRERVKNDPAYHITRMLNANFKIATGFGKFIRSSLLFGKGIKCKQTHLTAALLKVLSTSEGALHERCFANADFSSMDHFNLNDDIAWKDCINLKSDMLYSARYKKVTVFLPGFIPSETFKAPEGVTHVRLTTRIIFMEFPGSEIEAHEEQTTILPLKELEIRPETIIAKCENPVNNIWMVAMGVTWYQPGKNTTQLTVSKIRGPLTIVKMGIL
jgi:hypothetical protein